MPASDASTADDEQPDTSQDRADGDVRTAVGSSGQDPVAGLARRLSELARQLQADPTMNAVLQRVVTAACSNLQHVQWAAISEITGQQVITRAASDPIAAELDQAQYEAGDGPCLTSLRRRVTVRSNDLDDDPRWPVFTQHALEFGIHSILSVQLFVHDDNLGALNLYSDTVDAFNDDDESTAMLLAAHAAIAMKGHEVESNLRIGLRNRDVIGQAKGILMERFKIDETQAFDLLVASSQHSQKKLSAIAERLALTGELYTG